MSPARSNGSPRRRRQGKNAAEPWRRFLWKGRSDPVAIAFAKEAYERDQIRKGIVRSVVGSTGRARFCRRGACRRAGVCSGSECLFEEKPPMEETAEDRWALRQLYDRLKAGVAAADE